MGFGHTASTSNLSSVEQAPPRGLVAALLFIAVMVNQVRRLRRGMRGTRRPRPFAARAADVCATPPGARARARSQVSRVMIPSLLSTIKEDPAFGTAADGKAAIASALPTILPITSMTCLFGKLALGTATDRLGGSFILIIVFALFASSSAGLILTSDVHVFGGMWVLNSLAYTATWGAATQVIHAAFPKEEWPVQLSSIASAGRLGAAAGAIIYGFLLQQGLTWRRVFVVPTLVQLALIGMCVWQHATVRRMQQLSSAKDEAALAGAKAAAASAAARPAAPPDDAAGPSVLSLVCSVDFGLMFAAKAGLFVFTQWFMNFVGIYLRSQFGYSLPASTNAISVANAGQMIGLLFGGKLYKSLAPRTQAAAIAACLVVTTAVPALLLARSYVPGVDVLVLPLLFAWGLCFSVPFYLPAGTFALELGGKRNGALFTNLFDAGGFTACSAWNRYAAAHSANDRFDEVLLTLVTLGGLALCTMPACMLRRAPAGRHKAE